MAKTLTAEKIIEALPSLSEENLIQVARAVAKEAEKRQNDLEGEIKEKHDRLLIIKNGGK